MLVSQLGMASDRCRVAANSCSTLCFISGLIPSILFGIWLIWRTCDKRDLVLVSVAAEPKPQGLISTVTAVVLDES